MPIRVKSDINHLRINIVSCAVASTSGIHIQYAVEHLNQIGLRNAYPGATQWTQILDEGLQGDEAQ